MARLSAILRRFSWTVGLLCDISPTQFDCCQQLMKSNLPAKAMSPPALAVEDLRCEFLRQPLAIETMQPRLSWVLRSAQRGQKQTACIQVLVAASRERLADDQGDFWNSGQVESDQSSGIVYAGSAVGFAPTLFLESAGVGPPWCRVGLERAGDLDNGPVGAEGLAVAMDFDGQGRHFLVHPRVGVDLVSERMGRGKSGGAMGKSAGLKYFLYKMIASWPILSSTPRSLFLLLVL